MHGNRKYSRCSTGIFIPIKHTMIVERHDYILMLAQYIDLGFIKWNATNLDRWANNGEDNRGETGREIWGFYHSVTL